MAALDSDSDEDLVSYGTGLEPLEEGGGPMASGVWESQAGSPTRGRQRHLCLGLGSLAVGTGNALERLVHRTWSPRSRG